jgi:serine phosphatase RsbU (regulator of sigma subunit)
MTYAVVDRSARTLTYARAGHCPLLHHEAATGRTRVLWSQGVGLGLERGRRFDEILEESQAPLRPGDLFLLFTDGVSEAMNERAELFGEARLQRSVEEAARLGSEAVKERVLADLRGFVGGAAQHDDLTLVVLEVQE